MQSRMHDAEKMYCYLASNGMKFFTKLCDTAIDYIQNTEAREAVVGAQLSRMNLILALREGVRKETINFR